MKETLLILLTSILFINAYGANRNNVIQNNILEQINTEEYTIYSKVINHHLFNEHLKDKYEKYQNLNTDNILVLIENKTTTKKEIEYYRHEIEKIPEQKKEEEPYTNFTYFGQFVDKEAYNDFLTKNDDERRYLFKEKFDLMIKYKLFSEEESKELNKDGKLKYFVNFYAKYPDARSCHTGMYNVSKIGFNGKKDRALLFIRNSYGNQGEETYLIVLDKKNNDWIIKHRLMLSIS